MHYPDTGAVIVYFSLVGLGIVLHLSQRASVTAVLSSLHQFVGSSKWKHAGIFIPVWVGLAVGMAAIAQSAHSVFLAHLGFGLAYLFLLIGAVWGLNAWLHSEFAKEGPSRKGWGWAGVSILLITAIVITALFHNDKIVSLRPVITKQSVPLITLTIAPSTFPISAPPHSGLSLLPLHPFQTFTAANGSLHVFDNPCREDHFWPTQEEVDSKPGKSYEEVRSLEINNHSQSTMETAKVEFQVAYNDSFGGGCVPPQNQKPDQKDVVSIPPLDQGKAFQFFAVNQTNRCTWLIPPPTIKVKMAGEDVERDVPLKLDAGNIPSWPFTPFPPTTIKWQGVPTRNPGYGIARSVAACDLPKSPSTPVQTRAPDYPQPENPLVHFTARMETPSMQMCQEASDRPTCLCPHPLKYSLKPLPTPSDDNYATEITIKAKNSVSPMYHIRLFARTQIQVGPELSASPYGKDQGAGIARGVMTYDPYSITLQSSHPEQEFKTELHSAEGLGIICVEQEN